MGLSRVIRNILTPHRPGEAMGTWVWRASHLRIAVFHSGFRGFGPADLALVQAGMLKEQGQEVGVFTFARDTSQLEGALGESPVVSLRAREWRDALSFWHPTFKLHRRGKKAAEAFHAFEADLVLAYSHPSPALLGWSNFRGRKVWYCQEPQRNLFPQIVNRRLLAEIEAGRAPQSLGAVGQGLRAFKSGWRERTQRAFDRGGVGRLHHVLACSAYTSESLRMIYGPREIEVVHPMVAEPVGVVPRQGLRAGGLQILVQGSVEASGNLETILLGFDRFHQRSGRSARLHIVGDGSGRPALQALAASLPSAKAITFHGFLEEERLHELRACCEVFSLLPLDEAFGKGFVEAALHGQLLVGPDHGGPLEILEGGALGWALPPFDPEALADAYEAIQGLPDSEVDHYRQRAAQSCRSRFSPAVVARRLREVLASCVPGGIRAR